MGCQAAETKVLPLHAQGMHEISQSNVCTMLLLLRSDIGALLLYTGCSARASRSFSACLAATVLTSQVLIAQE